MSNASHGGPLVARMGRDGFRIEIQCGPHSLTADHGESDGPGPSGPGPFDLLMSALGSCVLMTIRMYAGRKGWPLEGASARVSTDRAEGRPMERARVELEFFGPLTAEQRTRLIEIGSRCPVHRTLEAGARIELVGASGELGTS